LSAWREERVCERWDGMGVGWEREREREREREIVERDCCYDDDDDDVTII
jgi:hypothetical protein